jgi:chromate transporter
VAGEGRGVTKFVVLVWIFLKSTCTSFAGLASLPEIREELVEQRQWATDAQLDESIVITRTTPGPVGVWVVATGYMVDGWPGALAGWIAMAAPSLVVIVLVGYFGKRAQHPRVRGMLSCVVLASATLLVLAAIPIGRDALTGPLALAIAIAALPVLLAKRKRIDTAWIVAIAAAVSLAGSLIGVARASPAHGGGGRDGHDSKCSPMSHVSCSTVNVPPYVAPSGSGP